MTALDWGIILSLIVAIGFTVARLSAHISALQANHASLNTSVDNIGKQSLLEVDLRLVALGRRVAALEARPGPGIVQGVVSLPCSTTPEDDIESLKKELAQMRYVMAQQKAAAKSVSVMRPLARRGQ